jgi:hypothetical protein
MPLVRIPGGSSERILVAGLVAFSLAGCAADADRMDAASTDIPASFAPSWQHDVCLRTVEGGEHEDIMSPAGIVEDPAFRAALTKTLEQSALLARDDACRYHLDVDILGISQPDRGLFVTSVRTDSHVNYKMFDRDQKPVFVDTVSASYTEDFSLLPAVARVQRASEGAVRANFIQFLQHLAAKPPES